MKKENSQQLELFKFYPTKNEILLKEIDTTVQSIKAKRNWRKLKKLPK